MHIFQSPFCNRTVKKAERHVTNNHIWSPTLMESSQSYHCKEIGYCSSPWRISHSYRICTIDKASTNSIIRDCRHNVNLEVTQKFYKNVLSNVLILKSIKSALQEKSRTARLWVQYIKYIETYRNFVRASRTGDWKLHLYAISKMAILSI